MTTPITAQGPGVQGMQQTAFPPPLGLEQYLGQQSPWSYPGQQQFYGQQNPQIQQFVQPVLSQLLPIAYQVILPQVVAMAAQQIHQQVQQLVAAQVSGGQQFGGQQFGGGQQPFGSTGRPWGF
jgi:hypothetical protein